MYEYIAFLQEGPFEALFYSWKPWVALVVLSVLLCILFMRARKREGIE